MARNVVNTAEVELFVAKLAERARHEAVRGWLRTTCRRWIVNHAPTGEEIFVDPRATAELRARDPRTGETAPYCGPRPAWLTRALTDGDLVFRVDCGPALEHDAWLVADWLDSLHETPVFARLDRIGYPQALAAARLWQRALEAEQAARDRAGDTETVQQFGDGYRIVRLKTERALDLEGDRMGHCVATYAEDLDRGGEILSLRDPLDRPHGTIEREGQRIYQIKGKQNAAPVAKYRPYLAQFIALNGLRVVDDGDNVDAVLAVDGRHRFDINEYVALLTSRGPLDFLVCYRGNRLSIGMDFGVLRPVVRLRQDLDEAARDALFVNLCDAYADGLRFGPRVTFDVFGMAVECVAVDFPFALALLRQAGVFRGREYGHEIRVIIERGVGALLDAADRNRDRLFRTRYYEAAEGLTESGCVDFTTMSRLDLSRLRHDRQAALRRRMARARRAHRRRLRDPSTPADVRAHWQTDWNELQTVLQQSCELYL